MKSSYDVLKSILFSLIFTVFLVNNSYGLDNNSQKKENKLEEINETVNYIDISKIEPTWKTVLGGTIVGNPVATSYGCVAMLDGRTVAALTGDGKIYWQKGFRGKSSPYITVTRDDFVYCVSDTKTLNFLNPNGLLLWSVENTEDINAKPKCGRDGRVFVTGENTISCYGLNGICRFVLHTDKSKDMGLYELPDGSLLFFMEKLVNNCSKALRISPYGKIIEEIIFTGEVNCCLETAKGVVLGFTNGNIGLLSINNNDAVSKWILPLSSGIPVKMVLGSSVIFVMYNNSQCFALSLKNTEIPKFLWKKYIEGFEFSKDLYISGSYGANRVTFLSKKSCVSLYSHGKIDWQCDINEKAKYFFTLEGSLIEFTDNWLVNSYIITQYLGGSKEKQNKNINISNVTNSRKYPSQWFEKQEKIYSSNKIKEEFLKGNYGSLETDFLMEVNYLTGQILQFYMQDKNSQIAQNLLFPVTYRGEIIELSGLTGTSNYSSFFKSVLDKETDPSLLLICFQAIENYSYDFSGVILESIDNFVQTKSHKYKNLLPKLCDSVFSICQSMGKPAIFNKGKAILSRLNSRNYDSHIKDYALETLEKLIALQI